MHVLTRPLLLHYYVTYRCNARCAFCDIWDPSHWDHTARPTWQQMSANLTAARRLGTRFVDFTGGEPLLYADLPQALRFARDLGFRTSITTNTLLYPKRGAALAGLVDFLHFSLDAMDPEIHDRMRGVPCFDSVMRSLDVARELGERPDLLFTATAENYREIEPLAELAARRRLMLVVNPVFEYFGGAGSLSEGAMQFVEGFAGKPYVYVNQAFHRLIRNGGNDPADPACHAVKGVIVISPDDHLLLPCFHQQRKRIPIEGRLEEIRRGEVVERFLEKDGRHAYCKGCSINCYMDPSFLYSVDSYLCLSMKAKLKYGIDKYLRRRAGAGTEVPLRHSPREADREAVSR